MAEHRVTIAVEGTSPSRARRVGEGGARRIGVIGDFSGRGGRPDLEARLAEAVLYELDCDRFREVLRRIRPELALGLPYAPTLGFASLEDFHPDEIATRVPALLRLLEARRAAADPERVRVLLEEAGADTRAVEPGGGAPPRPSHQREPEADGASVLDSLLEEASPRRSSRAGAGSRPSMAAFDRAIAEIVAASGEGRDAAAEQRVRDAVDEHLAGWLRAILHHPAFQGLEARWRGLWDLARRADGVGVRVGVLDLAAEDLLEELGAAGGDLASTLLHRWVVESEREIPGAQPFDLLVFDYCIEDTPEHARLAAALAQLAERAQATVVLAAGSSLSGVPGETTPAASGRLEELRGLAGARRLVLGCPRLLARLPFGRETFPTERFPFEEEASPAHPERYLWGSPAFALARAAVEGAAGGRTIPPHAELDDLPLHVCRLDGETRAVGPTGQVLAEPQIERLAEAGLTPIAAVRGTDTVRIPLPVALSGDALS